jgi:hypothetical protein
MPKDSFSVREELMTDWPHHTRLLVEDMEMVKIHKRKEMSAALLVQLSGVDHQNT